MSSAACSLDWSLCSNYLTRSFSIECHFSIAFQRSSFDFWFAAFSYCMTSSICSTLIWRVCLSDCSLLIKKEMKRRTIIITAKFFSPDFHLVTFTLLLSFRNAFYLFLGCLSTWPLKVLALLSQPCLFFLQQPLSTHFSLDLSL